MRPLRVWHVDQNVGRRSVRRFVVPLIVLLLIWVWLFYAEGAFRGGPSGKSFEADFAMFYSAAHLVHGGSLYDHSTLFRAERAIMHSQRLPMTTRHAVVRVGNPPLFFWLLQPLARVPFQMSAWIWIALMTAFCITGFICALRVAGWQATWTPMLVFVLMPQVVLTVFYGNLVAVVFCAMMASLLLQRRYPMAAGALLSVAWLKPPVALPLAALIVIFHVHDRRRTAAGFTAATAIGTGVTLVATGFSTMHAWLQGLLGYSRDMAIQPDVASLAGLYVRWAPVPLRYGLEAAAILAALGLTIVTWQRHRSSTAVLRSDLGWLWIVWLLATPYAHYFDEILLTLPLLMLLGPDCHRMRRAEAVALYLTFFSLFFIQASPLGANLLSLCLLATLWCWHASAPGLRVVSRADAAA